jgi:hypothetical protein
MTDDSTIGRRVRAGLARGRAKVLEARRRRLVLLRELVAFEARRDSAAGHGERGRAARIARRLSSATSRRSIYRAYAAVMSLVQTGTASVPRSAA